MQTKPVTTAEEYIAALPQDRRTPIAEMRSLVKKNLPKGYVEFVTGGMIYYGIPLKRFPDTYNGHPLCYVALAGQKNYCSLYLMSVYGSKKYEATLRDAFTAAGKRLDMGKSCVRFKTTDDLPMDAVGQIIASISADKWIEIYQSSRKRTARR
jgi:uncharacterized protein YdhG (YjbR/CyaY superfamily)